MVSIRWYLGFLKGQLGGAGKEGPKRPLAREAAAEADEPPEQNFVRKHAMEQAEFRV